MADRKVYDPWWRSSAAPPAPAPRPACSAWPVGIIGNIVLFTVFLGGVFDTPNDLNLYGQAGRQLLLHVKNAGNSKRSSRLCPSSFKSAFEIGPDSKASSIESRGIPPTRRV